MPTSGTGASACTAFDHFFKTPALAAPHQQLGGLQHGGLHHIGKNSALEGRGGMLNYERVSIPTCDCTLLE